MSIKGSRAAPDAAMLPAELRVLLRRLEISERRQQIAEDWVNFLFRRPAAARGA